MTPRASLNSGRASVLGGLVMTTPAAAAACPYCFGLSDNPNAPKAFLIGASILVFCTFGLLAGLVCAVRRIEAARAGDYRAEPAGASAAPRGPGARGTPA